MAIWLGLCRGWEIAAAACGGLAMTGWGCGGLGMMGIPSSRGAERRGDLVGVVAGLGDCRGRLWRPRNDGVGWAFGGLAMTVGFE